MGRTLFLPTSLKIVAAAVAAFLLWGLVLTLTPSPAQAATTYTVDRTDDPDLSTTPTAGACTAAANDCSLRGAITAANANAGDDTIDLLGVSGTVNLTGALPDLSTNIKIEGPGADKLTVRRDRGGDYRIFHTTSGSVVSISGITMSNGFSGLPGGGILNEGTLTLTDSIVSGNTNISGGGGISNRSGTLTLTNSTVSGNTTACCGGGILNGSGTLTLTNSTVSGNRVDGHNNINAGDGGGINNGHGTLTLTGSTVSGNHAAGIAADGGGIFSNTDLRGITTTITNSTLSGNTADRFGGGVNNVHGLTVIRHSTITKNTAPSGQGSGVYSFDDPLFIRTEVLSSIVAANTNTDVDSGTPSTFVSSGYNLIGDGGTTGAFNRTGDQIIANNSPGLGPLADNGGSTKTHALLADSPAVDKGKTSLTTDQRGQPRPFDDPNVAPATGGDNSDIGAFEAQEVLNTAPTAVDDSYSTKEDTPLSVEKPGVLGNDNDPDSGDTLKAVLVSGPSHAATFALNADGSFSYTPASNYNGPDSFTYKARDGHDADSAPVTVGITVGPVNDDPTANNGTASVAEDAEPITINFGALVSDIETANASLDYNVSIASADEGKGTLGSVAGDPTKRTFDSADDFNGTVTINYMVTDRGDPDTCGPAGPSCAAAKSASGTVTITVTSVNDPPTANAQSLTTNEDINKVITLAGDDIEGDTLSYKITSLPTNGKLRQGTTEITSADLPFSLSSNQVTYDPNDNYNNTAATADAFDFKVNDGSVDSAAAAKVSITVTPENDAPTVAVAAVGSCGTNDRSGTINLTVNDPDGQTQTRSLTLSATSSRAALVPASNVTFGGEAAARTLTATAVSGRTGTAVLTVTVSDGGEVKGTVNVRVMVDGNGSSTTDGTVGAEMIFGQNGADALNGLDGNDLLCGGRGNDTLTGGGGADHFGGGQGTDTATDFSAGDSKDGTIENF